MQIGRMTIASQPIPCLASLTGAALFRPRLCKIRKILRQAPNHFCNGAVGFQRWQRHAVESVLTVNKGRIRGRGDCGACAV